MILVESNIIPWVRRDFTKNNIMTEERCHDVWFNIFFSEAGIDMQLGIALMK